MPREDLGMRRDLVNAYMRGFRHAVSGQRMHGDHHSAFGHGHAVGRAATARANVCAGDYADRIIDSPAVAQARENARSRSS